MKHLHKILFYYIPTCLEKLNEKPSNPNAVFFHFSYYIIYLQLFKRSFQPQSILWLNGLENKSIKLGSPTYVFRKQTFKRIWHMILKYLGLWANLTIYAASQCCWYVYESSPFYEKTLYFNQSPSLNHKTLDFLHQEISSKRITFLIRNINSDSQEISDMEKSLPSCTLSNFLSSPLK